MVNVVKDFMRLSFKLTLDLNLDELVKPPKFNKFSE